MAYREMGVWCFEFLTKDTICRLPVHQAVRPLLTAHLVLVCFLVIATFFRSLETPPDANGRLAAFVLALLVAAAIDLLCAFGPAQWRAFSYVLFVTMMTLQMLVALPMAWHLFAVDQALAHDHHFFVLWVAIPLLFGFSLFSAVVVFRAAVNLNAAGLPL
ncbi:hypothetical protein M3Y99_00936600 [Aphelenchoides fujianensis]|nr:hypothetical protein M3Y99_00936600 [Aphelenchoides fujianensis]